MNYTPVCQDKVDLYFIMWPCVVRDHGLGYATPALASDLHVAGHPVADLWIASSATDADLFVYLEKISLTGEVSIVTHGRLRASLRSEQRPTLNYMGVPYHRGNRSDAQPLVPNQPTHVRLDLLPTSILVKAGERLRLTVAGADPRQRSRSVQFDPPPTISIYHDARHTSQLLLPVLSKPQFTQPTLPSVTGPIPVTASSEPFGAANARGAPSARDLAGLGYVEQEFFITGRATEYRYDEQFDVTSGRRDIPYTTRVLIRRPANAARFSGVVHLENAHPVQGGHAMWAAARRYFVSRGDAYVLLTSGEDALTRGGAIAPEREVMRAQLKQQGRDSLGALHALKKFDPERYASLEWPDDDAARWDAMTQAGLLLKSGSALLGGMKAQRIYAEGWSFTGSLLRTFINEGFHDRARLPDGRPIFDGYLIGISAGPFVSGMVSLTTGTPALPVGHPRRVTRSVDVPVIELMTENEAVTNLGAQAPDNDAGTGRHRLYEVAGLTHGDGLVTPGDETTLHHQLVRVKMAPPAATADACALEHSDVPMNHLASAALANLEAWVTKGTPPPPSQRLELDPASHAVLRDEYGNGRGGVRVAQLDVPLATYAEPGADAPPPCRERGGPFLRIRRAPLSRERLVAAYGSRAAFLARFESKVRQLAADRWLLPEDAALEIDAARRNAAAAFGTP